MRELSASEMDAVSGGTFAVSGLDDFVNGTVNEVLGVLLGGATGVVNRLVGDLTATVFGLIENPGATLTGLLGTVTGLLGGL